MRWRIVLMIAALAVTADAMAGASFYKWKDASGQWHFSDQHPAGTDAQTDSVETTEPALPVPQTTGSDRTPASTKTAPATRKRVVMYSTSWCGYCKKARAFLRQHRVPFSEYDVETSAKGKRDYKKYGASGVPIILVGKQKLQGFNKAALARLLGL